MRYLILLIFISITHFSYGQNLDYNVQFIALSSNTKVFTDVEKLGSVQIDYFSEQNIYRYRCGHLASREEAESLLTKIKGLGFSDAFIVNNNISTYGGSASSKSTTIQNSTSVPSVNNNQENFEEDISNLSGSSTPDQNVGKVDPNALNETMDVVSDSTNNESINKMQQVDKDVVNVIDTAGNDMTKAVTELQSTEKQNINDTLAEGMNNINQGSNNSAGELEKSEKLKEASLPVTTELEKTSELLEPADLEETKGLKESTELSETIDLERTTELGEATELEESINLEEVTDLAEATELEKSTTLAEATELEESTEVKESMEFIDSTGLKEKIELEETIELEEVKQEVVKEELAQEGPLFDYRMKDILSFLDNAHFDRDKLSTSRKCKPKTEDIISLNLKEDLETILKRIEVEYDVEYEDPECEGCFRIKSIKKK